MTNTDSCCVGDLLKEKCHAERLHANKSMHTNNSLSEEDLQLLSLRVPGIVDIEKKSTCDYHYKKYVKFYSLSERFCCDPCSMHVKNVSTVLTIVDLQYANEIKKICKYDIVPGKKLCKNCNSKFVKEIKTYKEQFNCCIDPFKKHRSKVDKDLVCLTQEYIDYLVDMCNQEYTFENKICNACSTRLSAHILKCKQCSAAAELLEQNDNVQITATDTTDHAQSSSGSEFQSVSQKKRKLDEILDTFSIPPFKRQKLSKERTINEGVKILQDVVNQVSESFESAYEVEMPKYDIKVISNESSWFKDIVTNIKEKYQVPGTTFNEKISLLTLLPKGWKFADIKLYIPCSNYMYNEAKKLRETMGVLGQRKRKTYLRYPAEIRKEIIDFYLDDTNSSECSGVKEVIKEKGEKSDTFQKRIMLYDQKDLYNSWKEKTTQSSIPCSAFFCQLKPARCFFAGEPGTHNICVCTEHQNVKLKIAAINKNVSYKDAIKTSVCSIENKNCMLRKCKQCPSKDSVSTFLSAGVDIENIKNVKYTIWETAPVESKNSENSAFSRMTLVEHDEPYKDVLNSTSDDIYNISQHHFISCQQKQHYCQCRKEIDLDTAVFVMDFAENYSFIAQNSPQGLYFNNAQATLFTGVLYYKDIKNNDFSCQSFCVISDTKTHQAYSVNAFQEAILNEIKKEFSWIKKLIYYSDGAPTQFKNKNHLINICNHENDFGIKVVSYNFFVTSHGKSAADGIGAAAKRCARKASLQGICILTAKQMYDYLSETGSDIKYLYVSDREVESKGKKLNSRFQLAKTIKNTRQYHSFEPIDRETMKAKIYSYDIDYEIVKVA